MGWYDKKDIPGIPNDEQDAANAAAEAANAEAKFRTDLIGALREIRDALQTLNRDPTSTEDDASAQATDS